MLDALLPPHAVRDQQHLRVALRPPRVLRLQLLQLRPQLAEVVDLAVVYEPAALAVGEGLVGAGIGVDDRQPAEYQPYLRALGSDFLLVVEVQALTVRPSVGDARGHSAQGLAVHAIPVVPRHHARESAHACFLWHGLPARDLIT